jgi:alpha-N-arabinofuranosidase
MAMTTGIRRAIAALAAGAVVAGASGPAWAGGTAAVTVTVRPGTALAAVPSGAIGVNTPIWNPVFTDPAVPGLIRQANIQTLEFNGGPVSDLYHWKTGTAQAEPDPTYPDYSSIPPQFSFDEFAETARATGAQTLVHVNYGTGTPQEAADWVRYARQKHEHVTRWAIGEEVWGNGGIPGIHFEPDAHADKSPQAYAANSLKFIAAMKKADPSAQVGVELFGVQGDPAQSWDEAVMSIVGTRADFVDVHAYPFGLTDHSDAALLAFPRTDAAKMTALRQLVDTYASPRTDLVIGETNSAVAPTAQQIGQVNALYLADDMLSLLDGGAANVDWWALHNGGWGLYGSDLGLLSTGDCNDDNTSCAPPAQTPFRPYWAMRLTGALTRHGGAMVPVSSSNPLVIGHAVRGPGGTLGVLVQNDDPAKAAAVRFAVPGYHAVSAVQYGSADQAPRPVTVGQDLPAYSLTVIQFRR